MLVLVPSTAAPARHDTLHASTLRKQTHWTHKPHMLRKEEVPNVKHKSCLKKCLFLPIISANLIIYWWNSNDTYPYSAPKNSLSLRQISAVSGNFCVNLPFLAWFTQVLGHVTQPNHYWSRPFQRCTFLEMVQRKFQLKCFTNYLVRRGCNMHTTRNSSWIVNMPEHAPWPTFHDIWNLPHLTILQLCAALGRLGERNHPNRNKPEQKQE